MSSFDRPRHETIPVDRPAPANQRMTFLEVLGQVIRARYPGLVATVLPGSASGPARLRVSNPRAEEAVEEIGCDFTPDGWTFVWCWGDGEYAGQAIGPAGNPHGVARAVASVVGIRHA